MERFNWGNNSNYYASTTLTDEVIQSSSAFHWNIIDAGNGYVYILSSDNTKAITITGINDGDNLIYSNYVPGNENQMWHLDEYSSDIYYIIPKLAPTKNIDIENNYSTSGSFLELKTHNDNTPRFRWIIE